MKPASDEETSPLTFGRYEALLRIGRGGMAEVYAGRVRGEAGFQKLVAIKRMLPHLAEDSRFSAMFLDEARLAAHISSPYVVTTQDLGRADDGSLYLVMELVVGATLSSFLRNAARHGTCVPLPISVEVLAQAAQGLHDAHEAKTPLGDPLEIVHRDVSPQNILVGVDGRARITDFGVARAMMRRTDTSTGELKGKLAYFSPEQVRDGELDRRSDIFALGIVAWETLTSRRLFKADNPLALLDRIMNMPIPSTRRFNPEVPEALDEAVQRALSRDLNIRYADGLAFAMALRAAYPDCGSRKDVSAYVREQARDRIERMEESLRTALARGDQSSIPSPNDARSGITRRNQLEHLRRQTALGVGNVPERPATDQTTAASDRPPTRKLGAHDLVQEEPETIDALALSPISLDGDDTVGLDDDELDAYDDGPTFAMEQAPAFDVDPIREELPAASRLQTFDEDAVALAAEPTVAVDPYEPSDASDVGYLVQDDGYQPALAQSAAQEAGEKEIPWKLIALIGGVTGLIGIALAIYAFVGQDDPPPAPQVQTVDPFAGATEAAGAGQAAGGQDTSGQAARGTEEQAGQNEAAGETAEERTSAQELLAEILAKEKQGDDDKAAEEAANLEAEEKEAAAAKAAAEREAQRAAERRAAERRAASRSSSRTTTKQRSTSSKATSTKPEPTKTEPTKSSSAEDDGRKHGRGGIRLDF